MRLSKGAALLAATALAFAACDFELSPDRVAEGSGETVTVAHNPGFGSCDTDGSGVEVTLLDSDTDTPISQGTTTVAGGTWSLDLTAPTAAGAYEVSAVCTPDGEEPFDLVSEELIVEPAIAPTVDPAAYSVADAPDTVTVTGSHCISSIDAGLPIESEGDMSELLPFVDVTLGGVTERVVATTVQPFDEPWSVTFAAPTTPGTHPVDVVCTYVDIDFDDVAPDFPGDLPVPQVMVDGESAAGVQPPPVPGVTTDEASTTIEVTGVLSIDADDLVEGDTATIASGEGSACDGAVEVVVTPESGDPISLTPAVADDGTWSIDVEDLPAGEHTVTATCDGGEFGPFDYGTSVLSVAATAADTTTTTDDPAATPTRTPTPAAAPAPAATPVRAQPTFTG